MRSSRRAIPKRQGFQDCLGLGCGEAAAVAAELCASTLPPAPPLPRPRCWWGRPRPQRQQATPSCLCAPAFWPAPPRAAACQQAGQPGRPPDVVRGGVGGSASAPPIRAWAWVPRFPPAHLQLVPTTARKEAQQSKPEAAHRCHLRHVGAHDVAQAGHRRGGAADGALLHLLVLVLLGRQGGIGVMIDGRVCGPAVWSASAAAPIARS